MERYDIQGQGHHDECLYHGIQHEHDVEVVHGNDEEQVVTDIVEVADT